MQTSLDNMPQIMRTIYFFSRYYGLTEDGGDAVGDFYKMHQHIFYCLQAKNGRMAMEAIFSLTRSKITMVALME